MLITRSTPRLASQVWDIGYEPCGKLQVIKIVLQQRFAALQLLFNHHVTASHAKPHPTNLHQPHGPETTGGTAAL
ncbi:hypothetical protein VTJ04DRAFT_4899 [Mycothermus thermophilus]|uniref:uncharacterized protein n=1 Tax=Humicola insolens TaxID=85995 RepID=UPI00374303E6